VYRANRLLESYGPDCAAFLTKALGRTVRAVVADSALTTRRYDAFVLCQPDFPFVQDGTRRDDAFRWQQHAWYLEQLPTFNCPLIEARGSVSQRVSDVSDWLSQRI
jgi:nicotinamide riboside kinase